MGKKTEPEEDRIFKPPESPHFQTAADNRDQILFRFTIGSADTVTCAMWEPGAPTPEERIAALEHAFREGFHTSVSMEPMLEGNSTICALVDFAARQQKAMEEARPHREKTAELAARVKTLADEIREEKKSKHPDKAALAALEEKAKVLDREAREAQAKAESIEDAAFDLKAVNPNRVSQEDKRTPQELLAFIGEKGREADAALAHLNKLAARPM